MTAKDLKNALLQEAVQGKLVPQIASEGNAKDLLEEIKKEKAKLIKEGKLKKEKPLPEITEDEIPFDIPENWCWVRWGDLSESIQYGFNAPAKETGRIKMVRISDIHDNNVKWETVPYCDIAENEIDAYLLAENDILFARTGGTVGKSFIVKNVPCESIYAGYLIRTRYSKKLIPMYLKYFMESELYWEQLRSGTIATAQPNCNGQTLSKMIFPLPPITEQKRIVAAIEQFMPLIEEYGKKEAELTALNADIAKTLKNAILQEAVQGKLVPQIASEGNAKDLLEEIKKEKAKLIKEGKLKKEKPLPEITEEEIPFDIPENWYYVRVSDIGYFSSGQTPKASEITTNGTIPYFKVSDMNNKGNELYMNTVINFLKEGTKYKLFPMNSIIFPKNGGAVFTNKKRILTKESLVDLNTGAYIPYKTIYFKYVFLMFSSIDFKKYYKGTALPTVDTEAVKSIIWGLPPFEEQKRIVDGIEKLLPLCEKVGENID